MQEHQLAVTRTARYFTLGTISERTRYIWIVCHGYGQLAQYFIKNFNGLNSDETLVVAPEALSRFYLSETTGRVGASWMTKEDRLNEIDDYSNYLETLLAKILEQSDTEIKVFVLGFSQGVSAVCRWLAKSRFTFGGLVLWAGSFPPELANQTALISLRHVPVLMAAGTNDPYLSQDKINEQLTLARSAGLQPELYLFNGKHEINRDLWHRFHWQLVNSEK